MEGYMVPQYVIKAMQDKHGHAQFSTQFSAGVLISCKLHRPLHCQHRRISTGHVMIRSRQGPHCNTQHQLKPQPCFWRAVWMVCHIWGYSIMLYFESYCALAIGVTKQIGSCTSGCSQGLGQEWGSLRRTTMQDARRGRLAHATGDTYASWHTTAGIAPHMLWCTHTAVLTVICCNNVIGVSIATYLKDETQSCTRACAQQPCLAIPC